MKIKQTVLSGDNTLRESMSIKSFSSEKHTKTINYSLSTIH